MLDALLTHPVSTALTDAFAGSGHCLFVVGGSVRDALAGTTFDDLDYTTDARPAQILTLVEHLGPSWRIGEEFGTIGVSVRGTKVEITTFRTESYDPGSRKPTVAFGDTIVDDLRRRDLTINAIAGCLVSDGTWRAGALVDPFHGAADLAAGLLRTPDEATRTMSEDPLRQLRVLRFMVTRKMRVDAEVQAAIVECGHRLGIVALERRNAELRKILAAGPAATAQAARFAAALGIERYLLGAFADAAAAQDTHLGALTTDADPETILALLAVDLRAAGGSPPAEMRKLKLYAELRPALTAADLAWRLLRERPDQLEARRIVRRYDTDTVARALEVTHAVYSAAPLALLVADVAATEPHVRGPLPIDGHDLVAAGLSGVDVGRALTLVTDAFLADPTLDRAGALRVAFS
jgi:tRNA nucleotidyltransferase/poly(A) polymerase